MSVRLYKNLWMLLPVLLQACGSTPMPDSTENDDTILLETRVFSEAGMDTARVADTIFYEVLRCSGRVDVHPAGRRLIGSPVGGVLNHCNVMEGERVPKGSLLFHIESQDIAELQYNYLDAKAQLSLLTAQVERARRLSAGDATSQRDLQQAEAAYTSAKARYEAFQQKIGLLGLSPEEDGVSARAVFRAPFNGIVAKRMAQNGQFVQADMPVLELIDDSRKIIRLELLGNQRQQAEVGQRVMLFDANGNRTDTNAILSHISPTADPATSAVSAIATITPVNADRLPVGAFVQAGIITAQRKVKFLPATAIIPLEGKKFVLMVIQSDAQALVIRPEEVKTGQTSGTLTEILSPLPANRTYITKGGFQLLQ